MKKITSYLTLLLIVGLGATALAQTTLISNGANYAYYDNANEPSVQGSFDWNDLNYDDSSWSTGNAHLGYGDGDEATVVNSNTLTLYVRHEFNVSDPSNYDSLNLNLLFDDGAVVYLNGSEVWRINMPGGSISYSTFSSSVGSENGTASTSIANTLVAGNNVIAVEIHQASSGSSDISFDFELTANAPGVVNVNRGPYLQKGTSSSMVVRWRTATPTESVIDYGTALGSLNQQVSDLNPKTEHELEITGLNANTVYYYQISNASAVLVAEASDVYFKTHPIIGSVQPFTFWALGDAGTANANQMAVRDAYYNYIGSNVTDGMLFLGDNAYNSGTDNEYQAALFDIYDEKLKHSVAWSTLGNHDGYSADSNSQTGPYYDIFTFPTNAESGGIASGTEAYYSFDYGNVHFIILESYETDRSVGGAMYNWAINDIQSTTQQWIVAIWHHPPYTKGSHNSDTETELVQMRQNFLPMLESNGVDLVLSGHSHSYERSYFLNGHYGTSNTFDSATQTVGSTGDGDGRSDGNGAYMKADANPEGAVYITAGSSGKISGGSLDHNAMYASLNQLGSCILEVSGNVLNLKFIRETGVIADYFTIQKGCDVGSACDDGDDCTINDVLDANCNCVGTALPDSDGDGVCDDLDQCPGQDDALIGTSCDDGDDCTINDVYDENCGCSGTLTPDSDGDGVCDALDQCPGEDDTIDANSNGIPDGCEDLCESFTVNFSGGGLAHSGPGSSSNTVNIPTDGQDINFVISNINNKPNGKPSGQYNERVIVTYVDGFGFPQSYGTYLGSVVSNVTVDIPGMVTSVTVTLNDALTGNTSGNMGISFSPVSYCINTVPCTPDSDGDGVCDAEDQCPGQDDALIGTACDDGDACTTGDIYDLDCNCAGTYTDTDGDGICVGDDPDDNDPCVPNASSPACIACGPIISDGFESGFGNWNDGGNDCSLSSSVAYSGSTSVQLRDNGVGASTFTNNLNLAAYSQLTVSFFFYGNGMDSGEGLLLELSNNGGNSYSTVQRWDNGIHFENGTWYHPEVVVISSFSTNTRFRLRATGTNNGDQIYIDDVEISDCAPSGSGSRTKASTNTSPKATSISSIRVYPNPAQNKVFIEGTQQSTQALELKLYNVAGQMVKDTTISLDKQNKQELDVSHLSDGLYLLRVLNTDGDILQTERLVIKNK